MIESDSTPMESEAEESVAVTDKNEEAPKEQAVERDKSEEFLYTLLESEEYLSLTEELRNKIEDAIQKRINTFIVREALHLSSQTEHAGTVEKLRAEIEEKSIKIEELSSNLKASNEEITSLQNQLRAAAEEVLKANESCKKMQYEWQDFKTQRDLACDEKESLLTMIERRNAELLVLREEKAEMTKKLEAAIKSKMAAIENAQEVESLKINLDYKEARLEQEFSLLKSRIQSLTEELNDKSDELINLRRNISTSAVSNESELTSKTEELRIAVETIADLKGANEKLSIRAKELLEKLSSQRESYDVMMDNFHQELSAQTKLARLYKDMCSENDSKTEKLTDSIEELRKLLAEATERYGELETKQREKVLRLEEEVYKRDECIQNLKKELQDANDLLEAAKQESVDATIGSLSPCAAAASRLLKSGMTLTQIYTQYARVSEELALEKEENRRLNLYVTTIVSEIEDKAPLLQQQRVDYEKAIAAAQSLTQEMDRMIAESQILTQECAEAKKASGFLSRENQRLKKELEDLARQVCYLVKAVEEARGGVVTHDTAYEVRGGSAQDIISKRLVTFSSIEDLQENNQKLLALVRQLSEKQEAVESVSTQEYHDLKAKKEKLEQRVVELHEEMALQSKLLNLIRTQSTNYKKLYNQAMGNDPEVSDSPSTPVRLSPGLVTSTPLPSGRSQHDEELSKKLKDSTETIKKLEDEIDECKKNLRDKEVELNGKIDKLSSEVREWMYKNSKLVAQAEYNEEKSKVLDSNLKTTKKQVQALEERNRTLSEICAKHEQSLIIFKDQAMEYQSKLARAEVQRDNLQQEVLLLRTAEARLTKERESLSRERINNSLLMNNLDGLKAALDRSEAEGKLRLEVQLSEALKECSALRSCLRDEKERFKELANSLERQTSMAKERMLEEKKLADKAREDLLVVKVELETKTQVVAELNEKIRELGNHSVRSVIHSVSSNLDASTKKVKELEKQVSDLNAEIARLQIQLTSAQASNKQYVEMAETAETQLQSLLLEHHCCTQSLADKEKEWAGKIEAVEKKLKEALMERDRLVAESESRVRSTVSNVHEMSSTLSSVQADLDTKTSELKNVQKEVEVLSKELAAAKEEINLVKHEAIESEGKYEQEVVLHSQAIQSLDAARKALAAVSEAEGKLRQERDNALSELSAKTSSWNGQKSRADEEIKQLNDRLKDLDEQNRVLHDTLQKLNNDLSIIQAKVSDQGDGSDMDTSLNISADLSNKAQEQLMKVIKFLRQEKDIATTKGEVLQAESTRLKAQLALLQKQIEETNSSLKTLKESTDVSENISSKHAELLRKVESLNAVTDSNRLLREERNRFKLEATQLTEKLAQAEASIAPLRAEIKQLKEKLESMTMENQVLATDVNQWKTRTTQLSERTKASPEDWRRLNNERENLAKQLQTEKSNNEKLEESLKKLRQENSNLSDQIVEVRKNLQTESAEVRRISEELNVTKQKLTHSEQELNTVRAQVKKLTEEVAKATVEVSTKEAVLTELRANITQVKKIAKKYKTQFEQLMKTTDDDKKQRAEEDAKKLEEAQKPLVIPNEEQERLRAEGRSQISTQLTELEAKTSEKLKELQSQVTAAMEEAEALRKDNDALKGSNNEKEERAKQVIKTARNRIAQLTEQKQNLEQELIQSRSQVDQSRDDSESKLNTLKANYDAMIARMEKERTEQADQANQERERMANQIKVLNQRINQMQRSLDKPKPSTSSQPVQKSTMEPPTANIKPMAGSSTARKQKQTPAQQLVGPYWSAGNETPFASIRPVQTRTLAVQPTSLGGVVAAASVAGASAGSSALMVPLQQQVHTTGNSGEALSSSPTSSHTDYMPATSSATPIRVVVAPVPLNAQSTQEVEECILENEPVGPPPQTVAMITPRVEAAVGSPVPGPSSTSSQASSSNTVTTTQAGLKRPRDVEGDSSTGAESEHAKSSPQLKRTRVSGSGQSEVFHHLITHSEGSEVEYQVPTSSQRDQEDDMVIMLVDSEDDGNADEGEAEEPDDGFEEEDNGEGYEVESYSRDGQDMGNFEEGPDIDEENAADGGSNEVEIIEDSNEVPVAVPAGQEQQQQSSEATSSGNDNSSDHVVVSHAASSQSFRTRSVPPLNRAQPSLQGYEEGGDDSIVPSTPTLFLPRRGEGFGEAVSSPQVPHQRFTFSEPSLGTSRRDEGIGDDPGTGRSVPTTPLVASPQEACQDQAEPSVPISVPHIPVNVSEEEMPPPDPSVAPADDDFPGQDDSLEEHETVTVEDDSDGVTSEGEKPPAVAGEFIEEGREAEASEPIARIGGTARRSGPRRGTSRRPTPIVWNEPGSSGLPTNQRVMTRGLLRGRGNRRNWN